MNGLIAANGSGVTRIEGVMAAISERIAARSLPPGARLPSVRSFAKTMQMSVSTVVEAYERLAAEGVIRSRPGSGFYVCGPLAPLSLSEIGPRLDRDVDPLWISRQSLEVGEDVLKPGCGWLPPSWMPQAALRRAMRSLARVEGGVLTDYGTQLGLPPLRQLLARRMAEHGIAASPDQIMLTESGTQAIDLICRFLLEPGDTVLVDDPCYFNFHALLRAHRANVVGVPFTPTGPDIALFGEALEKHRPRLYITNSAVHNPTGATLSPVTAHRLLKLADASDLIIVEDDIFADFEQMPAPRLAAYDGLDRVIHIGSFSKTLSASVRCGFIAARPDWIDGLVDLKVATSFSSGQLAAELLFSALKDGSYRKHMEALRARLAKTMSETAARLEAIGIVPWLKPQAGMFLWCRLPEGIEAADIARACLAEGVILAPGNAFSLMDTAGSFMRFNVAQSTDPRIFDVLAAAMRTLRRRA
ncbi:PLP-dependent aminotransferase family protein [Rhizobium sp. AP16]|uniref:aminotransferase-like domain-containing protein n=1 Tax=Rhizobium sp. AP16 TaxID=1144306 RepID=UPI00026EE890|nr:PLP-dependent aminotransferase family protein [Rhizobium sp. AP16]EJK83780.1 transcriptional regulator with HTH domain and aminotransferase domain-containing protein [Rhizobium sp. AP16]